MPTIHRTAQSLGRGFQIQSGHAVVYIHSYGDTLTAAGMLAVVAAIQTYYGGLGGASVGPSLVSAGGGAAAAGTMLHVEPSSVTVQCKLGDEATLANSLAAVLTGANVTNTVPAGQLFGAVN